MLQNIVLSDGGSPINKYGLPRRKIPDKFDDNSNRE